MPEVLADLYDMTGDGKYLDAARKFCHRALLDPMSRGQDVLNGWHANTQIPKVTGFERIYELCGQSIYDDAARFFWKTVVEDRTYAPGGNSDHEHFFPPEQTPDHIYRIDTAETCNVHNMLKLTRKLYRQHPEPAYLDYQERALLNHIVGSHELKGGMFTYMQPLKSGAFRGYSDPVDSEWCCVGTGMENPAMYSDGAFWSDQDGITIGLYLPAEAKFTQPKVTLRQETRFPAEDSYDVTCDSAAKQFLRCTWWSGDAGRSFQILVDGKQVAHFQSGAAGEEFVDADYPMPPELTHGKQKITVRFEADPGSVAGGLYGLRVIREK